jgi:hypothetical protein
MTSKPHLSVKNVVDHHEQLSRLVTLITNRLFNNHRVFISSPDDVITFLIRLVEIAKRATVDVADLSSLHSDLANSLFAMIYNLVEIKLQSNESKYLDVC